ncbi:hypothetical protein Tco_1175992, partial [Tanacetum coccineum]
MEDAYGSECSSGCESGWTLYLEHSMYDHHPSHPYQNHNNNVDDCNGKKWSFSHENDFDADDEDMSMVSDASSGPPHCFQEQEDDQCFNNNGKGGVYTNVKRQKNIIPKEPKLHRKVQNLPCLLDDTASSPFYNFSNNNLMVTKKKTNSMENNDIIDYSQGYSTTYFEGKSAYQDHFGFFHPSVSGTQLQQNQVPVDPHISQRVGKAEKGLGSSNTENYIRAQTVQLQSVEGMKVVCQEFEAISKDPEVHLVDDLIKDADRLVSCLAAKVAKTFDISLMGASSRSCKYVLNTRMQAFQNKRFAHAVNQRTLDNLITELLLWSLDERVPRMDDGSQLLKALNVLMLKILDNAERTSSCVVIICLLKPLDPSRWSSPPSNESFATRNMKFSNLVVKCLIKLTKDLQSTIYEVDLDRILQCIHLYLQELGIEEIRR